LLLALVLVACRPMKDPPPPTPAPPPLPTAPGGDSAPPALFVNGSSTSPLSAPDPDVIAVDPSWCASIPSPTTTTTTTTTIAPTTTTTPPVGPTGCYYEYSTPTIRFAPTAVPVYRSTDLVHWYPAGPLDHGAPSGIAFDGTAPGAEFPLWAPAVVQMGPNRFVMWFSEKAAAVGEMCLWSATASAPNGPFSYATGPWCKTEQGGSIDPSLFVDNDGAVHLLLKTEGIGAPYVPTRIFEFPLSSDAVSLKPGGVEHQLLEVMPAPSFEYPIVEAPTMIRSPDGTLFLFYSANNWYTADYKVAVAKCDSPIGPCNRIYSTPLLASRGAMLGPGGQTPFKDAAGNWQLAFHAWATADLNANPIDGSLCSLRFLPITFPGGNPKVG
jgi:beta-xylosidase